MTHGFSGPRLNSTLAAPLLALAGSAASALAAIPLHAQKYPEKNHTLYFALSRRHFADTRAADQRKTRRGAGSAGIYGFPAGRRRQHRHGPCRQIATRGLHPGTGQFVDGHRPQPLQ